MTSPSSTNREKFEKIGRSDRLLHPEDRKNSLWSDCSLIEIKKTVTDQTATCFPFWEIWLVNLKYKWSCCHCIISICLQVSTYQKSLVSLIYSAFIFADLTLSKWKCYIIWHIQKKENCEDNCPSRSSGQLSSHYEKINTQSQWWTNQYTFSMLFSRADLRESMVFYDFFSRPMFARMFSLLVYLRGQCSSLKQEHLSYLFIDSL